MQQTSELHRPSVCLKNITWQRNELLCNLKPTGKKNIFGIQDILEIRGTGTLDGLK